MHEKEEVIKKLNEKAQEFSEEYGEFLCLKANIAAINKMLIDRNRGQELLDNFTKKIEEVKNG